MKKVYFIFILIITLSGCKSAKNKSQRKNRISKKTTKVVIKKPKSTKTASTSISKAANAIIREARTYKGTKYKYGGNTKRGIDCSGLIHNAFGKNGIAMPRTSRELAKSGDWIDIKKVVPGDLVFFATKKNSRTVNHVGIVTSTKGNTFQFIHSTTSRGVIESKISERYWYLAYVQARRYL